MLAKTNAKKKKKKKKKMKVNGQKRWKLRHGIRIRATVRRLEYARLSSLKYSNTSRNYNVLSVVVAAFLC